jgi:hypothetical protein
MAKRHHQHLVGVVDLALVDHHHQGLARRRRARQNLPRERRHHIVDHDQLIAQKTADPLIPHVRTLRRPWQRRPQLVQIDIPDMQRRRHKQGQARPLFLALRWKPRQQISLERRRHRFNPTHPRSSAKSKRIPRITSRSLQDKLFLMGGEGYPLQNQGPRAHLRTIRNVMMRLGTRLKGEASGIDRFYREKD